MKGVRDSKGYEIIRLYFMRDEAAIVQTSEKYGRRLKELSYHIVEDAQTAEECENDIYLQAWNTIPPHEPYDYFYAYLARIARHLSLNYCRSRNRLKRKAYICELSAEMEQCIPSPNDCECQIDELLLREAINRFLRALSHEKRNMFLRRYWYLDSVKEIAKRFGCSESKIKTTLHRIRNQLREYLEKEGYTL